MAWYYRSVRLTDDGLVLEASKDSIWWSGTTDQPVRTADDSLVYCRSVGATESDEDLTLKTTRNSR